MRVLIYYKGEKRFKVLEAHGLECTPYPERGRVAVELHTPIGGVVLEAEGDVEEIVEEIVDRILNDLLSEGGPAAQVVLRNVVRERWR
ncbi:MAG: hypothetical protein ACK4G4_11950 [Thermus sp.]|uniref:hypothetical protein n=1 Tax=Thermus sp. TaxID=275 RepID=UPI002FE7CE57